MTQASPKGKRGNRRKSDGGVYLVVADESEEFGVALSYAVRCAQAGRAHVGILHIIDTGDFQHWGNVEAIMRKELRAEAEKRVWAVAKEVQDLSGLCPALYIAEGKRTEAVAAVIDGDDHIRMLILGGGTGAAGPGPLVQYFTGKGLGRLRVPVTVVPAHSETRKIGEPQA